MSVVQKIFGTHSEREIKRINGLVDKIEGMRPEMMEMTDEQMRDKTKEFKKRLTNGETLDDFCRRRMRLSVRRPEGFLTRSTTGCS